MATRRLTYAANLQQNNFRYFSKRLNSSPTSIAAVPSLNLTEKPEEHTTVIPRNSIVDFDDVSRLFKSVTTPKLMRSALNLHVAAIDPMVDVGMWVMKSKLMETPVVRNVILGVIKQTFFEHFCAGESPDEAGRTIEKMWNDVGMRGMMVYGLEHTDDNDSCDRNLNGFLQTVESAKSLPPSSVSFVIVKITAICPTELLKRVSDLLRWEHKDPSFHLPWKLNTLPIFAESSPSYHTLERPDPLTPQEEHDLELGLERLHKLCKACLEANVTLSIDAEDTIVQPAIDYFTYSASITYNRGEYPVLFGTLQAYLKDAKDRLFLATEAAQKMGIPMGFKIVRGAYMSSEEQLANSLGFDSPIHNTIQDTHNCYNDCASYMLDKISNGYGAVVLATHNVESGKMAATKARDLGIGMDSKRLQFAQLYGMAQALSFGLKNAGFLVSKYMPFGPIDLVIPYLLRRAEENRGMLSSSLLDRTLMTMELKRRLKAAFL